MEMDSRIAQLDGVVAGKVAEIQRLVDATRTLRNEMEGKLAERERTIYELRNLLDSAEKDAEQSQRSAESRISDLAAQLSRAEERLVELNGEIEKQSRGNSDLKTQVEKLEKDSASTQLELGSRITDLTIELDDTRAALNVANEHLDKERSESTSLRAEVSALIGQVETLDASLEQEQRNKEEVEAELAFLRRKHESVANGLADLKASSDREVTELKSEIERLIQRMERDRATHEERVARMMEQHSELAVAHAEACDDRDTLQSEKDVLVIQLAKRSTEAQDLKEQLVEARMTYRNFSIQRSVIESMELVAGLDKKALGRTENLAKTLQEELSAALDVVTELQKAVVHANEEAAIWKSNFEQEVETRIVAEHKLKELSMRLDEMEIASSTSSCVDEDTAVFGDLRMAISDADSTVAVISGLASAAQIGYVESLSKHKLENALRILGDSDGKRTELETIIVQERFSHNQERTRIWEQLQKVERENQQLISVSATQKEDLREARDTLDVFKARLAAAEKEIETAAPLRDQIAKLRQQIDNNAQVVVDAERKIAEAKATLRMAEQLEAQNAELYTEIDELNAQVRQSEEQRMELEENMRDQLELIMKKHTLADREMSKLNEINAHLLGHQNTRQKIKYVDQIKKENLRLKKETVDLSTANQKYRIRIMKMERDLEALRSITNPVTSTVVEGEPNNVAPRPRSRVGRAVLASREEATQATPQSLRSKSAGARPGDRSFALFSGQGSDDNNE
ncbi:hypothetical protein M427DRAFT_345419 [Gonapodya prolifera JEL478]|uniref:Hyaluronan-mediated motility receptor C-terminal domain-containing protein n=1 Tax=Gonapodya prolifera (strain JEL478) TaxID=1344416 RepID=A0A139AVN5_GONPJ|nr:hypothetical protein M427DRAFT_345419 [Gonapodya prolifera JEL478]|eukprot:KXS20798.1 hypothetical protein M427DRAFT_345419 [Gonapodya prolifera JEL478]